MSTGVWDSKEFDDTAATYHYLACCLDAQGRYAEAQPYFEKAVEVYRRLGPAHDKDAAVCYYHLADCVESQGRYAEAERLFVESLQALDRWGFKDRTPQSAYSCYRLAANLHVQGRYAEAQPLFEKALEIHRRLADDELKTARVARGLAGNFVAQGRFRSAAPLRAGRPPPPPAPGRRQPQDRHESPRPGLQPQDTEAFPRGPAHAGKGAGDLPDGS